MLEYITEKDASGNRYVLCTACHRKFRTPYELHRVHHDCIDSEFFPGTILAKLIGELGIARRHGCRCAETVARMNAWGAALCRQHRAEIVKLLEHSWDALAWSEKWIARGNAAISGLAFKVNWRDPAGSLVDEAIRRAEAHDEAGKLKE